MDARRRPDRVGAAFGVVVMVAALAVIVRVAMPGDEAAEGSGLRRFLPGFAGGRSSVAAERFAGAGLAEPDPGAVGPLSPLFYEGPRDLVAPAPTEPDELVIAKLGVRTRLLRLDKRADGRMEVPGVFSLAGWYVRGPAPGAPGPAVIAGHRDSRRGAAVFARLGDLAAGDTISVRRGDGHVVRFTVRRLARFDKEDFPTREVYGNTAKPELRLITCDGDFDRGRRSYTENLVVFAEADPVSLPPEGEDSFTPLPEPTPSPAADASPTAGATPTPSPSGPASPTPSASPSPSPSGSASEPEDTPSPRPTGSSIRLP